MSERSLSLAQMLYQDRLLTWFSSIDITINQSAAILPHTGKQMHIYVHLLGYIFALG